tara:strand:- start:1241 stop:1579 length:339 start_codon:yes stop_codon:yes gene_type:complete
MPTLFERVLSNSEDGNDKISIHLVQSLMSELGINRLTVPQCVGIMGLDAAQTSDFIRVLTAALSSTNKAIFAQRVFAYLLLGENARRAKDGGLSEYLVEANFWLMVDAEAVK